MTLAVFAFGWVASATLVAFLPMRYQYGPGLILLFAAPVLIFLLSREYGWWIGAFALAAFLSMFRRPLWYLARRSVGIAVPPPAEEEK